MFKAIFNKSFLSLIISILFVSITLLGSAQAASGSTAKVKEVNFVFLHGMGGNASDFQLLEDSIAAQMPAYITNYEHEQLNIKVQTDMLLRSYPNNVNIDVWANNIADAISKHFADKKNLVLIGHSMGGKTALYAVAHNIGNLADKVAAIVTINSPIKSLMNYYYIGGDTALDYWGAQMVLSNTEVLESLVNYDSSQDGKWVSSNKHWLAFISAESSPLSSQFNSSGIDPLPRDMDDTIVPISCQYAEGADVVYYGEYAHSDFTKLVQVADYMADQILRYIFGGNVACSVYIRGGSFEHKADLLPGIDYWQDLVGGVLANSGTLIHKNDSHIKWQNWEDAVGEYLTGSIRSNFQTILKRSYPILTGIKQANWAIAGDPQDGRLFLSTRAAPRSSVQVDWSIYQQGLLPSGITRDHYEIEVETGTQLTSIGKVLWETDNPQDVRLRISSQAQSPLRWFKTQWRVYAKEVRQRIIIDEISVQTLTE